LTTPRHRSRLTGALLAPAQAPVAELRSSEARPVREAHDHNRPPQSAADAALDELEEQRRHPGSQAAPAAGLRDLKGSSRKCSRLLDAVT
jgi:hypothetical protein